MERDESPLPERVGEILTDAYRLERRIGLDAHTETYFGTEIATERAVPRRRRLRRRRSPHRSARVPRRARRPPGRPS